MFLNEILQKSFLKIKKTDPKKDSSTVTPNNILMDLGDPNTTFGAGVFFDDDNDLNRSVYQGGDFSDLLVKQANKILQYRNLVLQTDVSNALEEIVNEVIFSYDTENPLKLYMNEENTKIQEAVQKCFDKIIRIADIKRNLYSIIKHSYVDGQLILHCTYDKKKQSNGIKNIVEVDPIMFYYDRKDQKYKIANNKEGGIRSSFSGYGLYDFPTEYPQIFDPEEIVRVDFGLRAGNLNLSYLEYAIKTANMLRTLEDLLVPLRFSRSVSRRVFNIDVGDIPPQRASEIVREYQNKFKYKKYYDNTTGEISNQQHITSMVEDYWFPNRNGGKGTTVDLLNEADGLGEITDILYFAKKLYRAMNVPTNRIDLNPDADHSWSYNSDATTIEDLRFFMFISRIRQVYTKAFKELLKREVISTRVMTESEWNRRADDIDVKFTNESTFIEKMKLDTFGQRIDFYHNLTEDKGSLLSVRKIMKDIFKLSDEEIEDQLKEIEKESKDKLFKRFYTNPDTGEWEGEKGSRQAGFGDENAIDDENRESEDSDVESE